MAMTPEQRLRKKRLYSAYRYQKTKSDVLKKQKEDYVKNPEKYRNRSNKSYAKCTGKVFVPTSHSVKTKLTYDDICVNGMGLNIYTMLIGKKIAGKHPHGKGCDKCSKDLRNFLDETSVLPPFYGYELLPINAETEQKQWFLLCKSCLDLTVSEYEIASQKIPHDKFLEKFNIEKNKIVENIGTDEFVFERSNKTHVEFLGQPPELQAPLETVPEYTEDQINAMSKNQYIDFITKKVKFDYNIPDMPDEMKNKIIENEIANCLKRFDNNKIV
ncbi:MAG: hypothetical protein Q8P20_01200 [bacterium]|nr:hypothetical protein [bacterium]